jgi:hypothetical protein
MDIQAFHTTCKCVRMPWGYWLADLRRKRVNAIAHFMVKIRTRQFWASLCFTAKTNFHFNDELSVYQRITRNCLAMLLTVLTAVCRRITRNCFTFMLTVKKAIDNFDCPLALFNSCFPRQMSSGLLGGSGGVHPQDIFKNASVVSETSFFGISDFKRGCGPPDPASREVADLGREFDPSLWEQMEGREFYLFSMSAISAGGLCKLIYSMRGCLHFTPSTYSILKPRITHTYKKNRTRKIKIKIIFQIFRSHCWRFHQDTTLISRELKKQRRLRVYWEQRRKSNILLPAYNSKRWQRQRDSFSICSCR